tara:strand:+ start:881 stop:1120 length:240 start_codon:yes stop_codon:yes gene_type:complete
MDKKKRSKSKIRSIINEIAYDLGINKRVVKQVLILTFKEIALTLILKGKPVMIRRFVKFVVAASAMRKLKKAKQKQQTK